jgi:hypothetical protein
MTEYPKVGLPRLSATNLAFHKSKNDRGQNAAVTVLCFISQSFLPPLSAAVSRKHKGSNHYGRKKNVIVGRVVGRASCAIWLQRMDDSPAKPCIIGVRNAVPL